MSAVVLAKSRRWRLNLDGQVEPADGHPMGTFTGQEWQVQEWPPCPVCGSTDAEPQSVDARTWGERFPVLHVGQWECPNGCDPRLALRSQTP
jgi:hypothetical protein